MAAKKKAKKKPAAPPKKKASKRKRKSDIAPVAAPERVRSKAPRAVTRAKASPLLAPPAERKTKPKKGSVPAAFDDLFARIDAIDWVAISNGSQGASFPKDLRAWFRARDAEAAAVALDTIWENEVNVPIGALATKFLLELLGHPNEVADVPGLLRLLVAMITSDHTRWLDRPFVAEKVGFMFSRLNKWSAIAERRAVVFALLDHADENVRAHAAFLLAWLGRAYSGTIVPALWEKTKDASPLVRASTFLAIGMHGEDGPYEDHGNDEDQRVALAAALASTFAPSQIVTDQALDRIEAAVRDPIAWPELPWVKGDLTSLAIRRLLALDERYAERTRSVLVTQLDGPLAEPIIRGLIARTFGTQITLHDLTEAQREVLALVVAHPSAQPGGVAELGSRGFALGRFQMVRNQVDLIRKLVGLPRPPPARGTMARVTHQGTTMYAQHWFSEWADTAEPADGRALARSIVEQVEANDLLELLLFVSDLEPDPHDPTMNVAFEHPTPEGGSPRADGALLFPHEGWPTRARAYMDLLRREGWLIDFEWWHLTNLTVGAHRDGRCLTFEIGNDWNSGNPIMTEARFRVRRRFSLARLVVEEAFLFGGGFEEALVRRAVEDRKNKVDQSWSHRLLAIAIRGYGGLGRVPPPELDATAAATQTSWNYVQSGVRVYASMIDPERREALVLQIFEESQHRVVQLYALAPTPRVLEHVLARAKWDLENWGEKRAVPIERWEAEMGEHAKTVVAAATR